MLRALIRVRIVDSPEDWVGIKLLIQSA